MKLLVITLLIAGAFAKPDVSHLFKSASSDKEAEITKYVQDAQLEIGKYYWEFASNNGIAAHAHGEQINGANTVGGEFAYQSPEGEDIKVHYTADENGYRAEGAHIPTPPPIPEAIVRSLQYIAAYAARSLNK